MAWGVKPGNISNSQDKNLLRFRVAFLHHFCSQDHATPPPAPKSAAELEEENVRRLEMLRHQYDQRIDLNIEPAPDPYILEKFGGSLTTEHYRSQFCTNKRETEFQRCIGQHQINGIRPVGFCYYLENIQMAPLLPATTGIAAKKAMTNVFGWSVPADVTDSPLGDAERAQTKAVSYPSTQAMRNSRMYGEPSLKVDWKGQYNLGQFSRQTDRYCSEIKLQNVTAKNQKTKNVFKNMLGIGRGKK
jgi:hypothetical protein